MLGLGLSRYLPAAVRPHVISGVTRARRFIGDALDAGDLAAKRKPAPLPYRGERVALFGFLQAPTGLGRGARLMEKALARDAITRETFDVTPLLQRDGAASRDIAHRLHTFAPTDIVLHVNPPSMRDAIRRLPRSVVLNATIVGYWAWELERLPASWLRDAALCDEIWAPSAFVADAVRASVASARPVRVLPHAVDLDALPVVTAERRAAARKALGIGDHRFVAGFSFSMASNFARKNPLAAIDAFQRAFPVDESCLLLLRCSDLDAFPQGHAQLRARTAEDPRVRLIGRDSAPITSFFHALDVFLSLHRSEGYGLQIVEALQSGVPVIGTAWSLGDDIINQPAFRGVASTLIAVVDPQHVYDHAPGARWAEPDIDDAAQKLRAQRSASQPQ